MDSIILRFSDVSLSYPERYAYDDSFQVYTKKMLGGVLNRKNRFFTVDALKDINFELYSGDRLAVLGHNGAGKSTLIKVAAGVFPQTSGEVFSKGKIRALTDLTLGFDANSTGFKNIRFRLIFMGYSYKACNELIPEIIEFSELADFIHMPLHTYSTGMQMRLAFSIATCTKPDILLLDEIIGAGDLSFQVKAQQRFEQLVSSSSCAIISTHDLNAVNKYCNKALLLRNGNMVAYGSVVDVISEYTKSVSGD